MGEYLHPGVFVEEKKFGTPPVTGGSTSVGAFVGFAPRIKDKPVYVTSWTDFVNQFSFGADSPFMKNAYLAYALYGFFSNGGQTAWVVTPTDGTEAKATAQIGTTTPITFTAKDAGVWANALSITIVTNAEDDTYYDVIIKKGSATLETHLKLKIDGDIDSNFVGVINNNSKLVTVDVGSATTVEAGALNNPVTLSGGKDGTQNITDGSFSDALNKFDDVDSINLLVIPESQSPGVISAGLAYARKRGDCFFITDGGMNDTVESIQTFKSAFSDEYGGLYFPWVLVSDPIGTVSKTKYVPSAGHVAGAFARNDANRGIYKAPAGTEMTLNGVLGVKVSVNDGQQDLLNPKGINVIRAFPDLGIVIWGARTMDGKTYVNNRRELSYVMRTIKESTKWAVFEPNDEELWRKITGAVTNFLRPRWQAGAYKGTSEEQAFFVKCDAELNTPDVVDDGKVLIDVGLALKKPGEFIIFRIGQWDGSAQ